MNKAELLVKEYYDLSPFLNSTTRVMPIYRDLAKKVMTLVKDERRQVFNLIGGPGGFHSLFWMALDNLGHSIGQILSQSIVI